MLSPKGWKIPGADTLTKIWDCSVQGLHDIRLLLCLLVSFRVIWRVSWYSVRVGLCFFTHLSVGWIIWCLLRDVVCHGLTISWLGRKEKKTQNNRVLPKPAILCSCRVCGRACAEQRVFTRHAQTSCTEMEEKQVEQAMCHICSYPPLRADGSVWSVRKNEKWNTGGKWRHNCLPPEPFYYYKCLRKSNSIILTMTLL